MYQSGCVGDVYWLVANVVYLVVIESGGAAYTLLGGHIKIGGISAVASRTFEASDGVGSRWRATSYRTSHLSLQCCVSGIGSVRGVNEVGGREIG